MVAKKSQVDSNGSQYERVQTKNLLFDSKNPRLVEYLEGVQSNQEDLCRLLWEQMAVDELALSIAASGYFDFEPLFVVEENAKLIVIEGNRRLAAVKLLLDEDLRQKLRATDLPKINKVRAKSLEQLPVIRTTREDAWQHLGFKHVNGPAKWDSYPKAHYIAEVHNSFGVPLNEIANQIGDKHRTVQRLYRALMVIEQAERLKVFHRENRHKGHFSFSHLTTGLGYDGIVEFLEVKDESAEQKSPVPPRKKQQLGELCRWLFGDKTLDEPPVVESQNPHLRQLNEVLQNKKATEALRDGMPLSVALEVSYGDEYLFRQSMQTAKGALETAQRLTQRGYVPKDIEASLTSAAVAHLAERLVAASRNSVGAPR